MIDVKIVKPYPVNADVLIKDGVIQISPRKAIQLVRAGIL